MTLKLTDLRHPIAPQPSLPLPSELTLHVLSFLPPPDLGRAAASSKELNQLAIQVANETTPQYLKTFLGRVIQCFESRIHFKHAVPALSSIRMSINTTTFSNLLSIKTHLLTFKLPIINILKTLNLEDLTFLKKETAASSAFENVFDLAKEMDPNNDWSQSRALETISLELAKAKGFDEAFRIAKMIPMEATQTGAFQQLVAYAMQNKQLDHAINVAYETRRWLNNDYVSQKIWIDYMVSPLLKLEAIDLAVKVAEKIPPSFIKNEAFRMISEHLAKKNNFPEAIDLAKRIADSRPQAKALKNICLNYMAKAGKLELALALAKTMTDLEIQSETLDSLSYLFAKAGNHDRAIETANCISLEEKRGEALFNIVFLYLFDHHYEQASEVAKLISHKVWRKRAEQRIIESF